MRSAGEIVTAAPVYQAFGLSFASEIELPLTVVGDTPPDFVIRTGRVSRAGLTEQKRGLRSRLDPDGYRVEWDGVGAFRIAGGNTVVADPERGVSSSALLPYLLGAVVAVLMSQRGLLVLHASSVLNTDGRAVLMLGHSGQGKSTLAVSCDRAGLPLLADDLAPVEFQDAVPWVHPGPVVMKLWPESVETVIGMDPKSLSRVHPLLEKRLYPLSYESPAAAPVGTIIVLQYSDEVSLEPVRGAAAVAELTRHSFCARILEQEQRPLHLRQCALLAQRASLYRFSRPRDLSRLDEVTRALLDHLGKIAGHS